METTNNEDLDILKNENQEQIDKRLDDLNQVDSTDSADDFFVDKQTKLDKRLETWGTVDDDDDSDEIGRAHV